MGGSRHVQPHPHKAGKARQAAVVRAAKAVGHPAANGRWIGAVCIGQPCAQLEALTRGHLHQQGAQPPGVFALAGQVAYDQGLRVVMCLQLDEVIAAA